MHTTHAQPPRQVDLGDDDAERYSALEAESRDLVARSMRGGGLMQNYTNILAVIMRLREPSKATALLFGTGKLCLTGVKNEDDAKHAARKIAKIVHKLGFAASFEDFKIQNLVASGDLGFPIRLEGIADEHSKFSSYEPELFPGLIYRVESPRVVLLVFVSGKICVTGAKSRSQLLDAVQKLYPVLYKVRVR